MKKIFIFLLMMMFVFVALEAFSVIAFAENENSQLLEVNAVEYEDEMQTENIESGAGYSDLITEAEAAAMLEEADKNQTDDSTQDGTQIGENITNNPETGVMLAIIPAAIALAILIILWIIKKNKK